jgi:two-component system, chemotaxis family, sensor histidine kinase and response regulator WspE
VNAQNFDDLSGLSMLELFRVEAENQTAILTSGMLELERGPAAPQQLETLMRAAHSLKGAARIVNLQIAVRLAHGMEDFFVAAQHGKIQPRQAQIDVLFRGVDLILQIAKRTEADVAAWEDEHAAEIQEFLDSLAKMTPGQSDERTAHTTQARSTPVPPASAMLRSNKPDAPLPEAKAEVAVVAGPPAHPASTHKHEAPERVLRLTAENLNRLLGLAGESLVESRWLRPFSDSMQRLKRHQADLERALNGLRQTLEEETVSERAETQLGDVFALLAEGREFLGDRLQELDLYDRRSGHLSHRLYLEVLRSRMRPFGDGTRRFPRMVRDLARSLGKQVRLEIIGENTQVDRDILERLETPLAHLLRNAVDHGCETAGERKRAGKPAECVIRLEARHSAGMLVVTVADDGGGVDPERLRRGIIEKKLTTPAVAEKLAEAELLEFLFLPGFTMKKTVTEISGRGVGLDVVQNMVKSVRGSIRVATQPGGGMRFQLQLPLTLSVLRSLLVEIADEPYAIPLAQIVHTLKLPRERVESLEGRHHFDYRGHPVGLLAAHEVLDCGEPRLPGNELPVVVLADRNARYGLVVDRFLGERELVVQPLDTRLGKVKDISAAALMEDGSPVLIVDVDDIVRSIEKLVSSGHLARVTRQAIEPVAKRRKRVLAVDDSLTVRELERKLLANRGYQADVAVDGMDGWNALRAGNYDLVITDVDMPRLDGIELATLIKKDPHLKSLPVMIVSYKDREEDRLRGLEAGADYYLTKGSFHDETLIQAVIDLIGEPES